MLPMHQSIAFMIAVARLLAFFIFFMWCCSHLGGDRSCSDATGSIYRLRERYRSQIMVIELNWSRKSGSFIFVTGAVSHDGSLYIQRDTVIPIWIFHLYGRNHPDGWLLPVYDTLVSSTCPCELDIETLRINSGFYRTQLHLDTICVETKQKYPLLRCKVLRSYHRHQHPWERLRRPKSDWSHG